MWIFINNNLINIFNIDTIKIHKTQNYDILIPYFIFIIFKDKSQRLIIRQPSLEEAEKARDLILIECNRSTSMLPKLTLTMESNIRINTSIEGYETTETLGEKTQ